MQIYTVHDLGDTSGSAQERADRLLFVRDGFAVFAVISPVLWFIWHKLWIPLVAYVVVVFLMMGIGEAFGLGETALGVLSLLVNIGIGLEANNIRRFFLARDGAREIGVVSGDNLEECEYRFFATWSDETDEPKGLVERLQTA